MDINEIERLVNIVRHANISELVVTTGTPQRTIKLRKQMPAAKKVAAPAKTVAAKSPMIAAQEAVVPEIETFVTAPMVGIFHVLESRVQVGGKVKAGQVLGSIESMKLMNDVVCKVDGTVADILIEDGMPVEYGHKLLRLETS